MEELFKARNARYFSKLLRYLKYVLNDHFVLVSLFLFGGLGYYYSNFVQTLPSQFIWAKMVLFVLYLSFLFVGKNVLLFEEADKTFLLVQETKLRGYLLKSFRRSLVFPLAFVMIVSLLLVPIVVQTFGSIIVSVVLFLEYVLYKTLRTKFQYDGYFLTAKEQVRTWQNLLLLFSMASFGLSLLVQVYLGLIVGMVFLGLSLFVFQVELFHFEWERVITLENERMTGLLKFFSMFTDVPGLPSKVKRRKYFDQLILGLEKKNTNPYLSLYLRAFFRGGEYGSLFLRLTVISIVLFPFAQNMFVFMGLGCLFLYLIGFQMLPLGHQFDYMILTQLYPVSSKLKNRGIEKILFFVFTILVVLYGVIALFLLKNPLQVLYCLAVYIGFSLLFLKVYVATRLAK